MPHDILEALTPLLIALLALLLSLALSWLSLQAHRYLGVQVEARHREVLNSAIMTGLRRSLAGDLSREQIIQEARHYVRTSVPDVVRALVKDKGLLRALAEAKLRELNEAPGRTTRVLEYRVSGDGRLSHVPAAIDDTRQEAREHEANRHLVRRPAQVMNLRHSSQNMLVRDQIARAAGEELVLLSSRPAQHRPPPTPTTLRESRSEDFLNSPANQT